jgi:hypothetical protein
LETEVAVTDQCGVTMEKIAKLLSDLFDAEAIVLNT